MLIHSRTKKHSNEIKEGKNEKRIQMYSLVKQTRWFWCSDADLDFKSLARVHLPNFWGSSRDQDRATRCIRKTCGWHDSDFDFEGQRLRDTALNLQKFVKRVYWMFHKKKKKEASSIVASLLNPGSFIWSSVTLTLQFNSQCLWNRWKYLYSNRLELHFYFVYFIICITRLYFLSWIILYYFIFLSYIFQWIYCYSISLGINSKVKNK